MRSNTKKIPIFFACDENYLKCLAVTVHSIDKFGKDSYEYQVRILTEGFEDESIQRLYDMKLERTTIELVNIKHLIDGIRPKLRESLRDYYSESIFYRIFIPSLYPELKKAVYLDCDTILNDDIARIYNANIGDNLLGAVTDESVMRTPQFIKYVREVIGVDERSYFNSGVLLINCEKFREERIEQKMLALIERYSFRTVAPDQDYLNFLCKDRVCYFGAGWNKQPSSLAGFDDDSLHLVHFNHFRKPWRYDNVMYEEKFWRLARDTKHFSVLAAEYESYSIAEKQRDTGATLKLLRSADEIRSAKCSFCHVISHEEAHRICDPVPAGA